jgi:hypothetical protein
MVEQLLSTYGTQPAQAVFKTVSVTATSTKDEPEEVLNPPLKSGGIQEPQVEVTFQTKDGARMITQFHEVILDQSTIACIFDTRFKYGSRFIPAETPEDAPFTVTIQPHKKTLKAYYFGTMFRFQHWDFLILITAEE